MALKFVLLVLPTLALTDIEVTLSGTFDGDPLHLYTSYTGQDVGVITNTERDSFGLNDNALKNAVRSFYGQRPDDVFLSSPTPWDDLYKTYHWTEVTRTLRPKNFYIVPLPSHPVTVMQQVFENNSTKPAIFDVGISKTVYNTFISTWWTNKFLSIEHKINYKINMVDKSGEMINFRYSSVWNQNTRWMQPIILGAASSMKVTLQPGQAVVADLQATRESILMKVEYAARLDGLTAVNYYYKYKGHHFHNLDITDCMKSAGISNQLKSLDLINIEFYSETKVVIRDMDHSYKLEKVPF